VGLLIGLINGLLSAYLKVAAFIATLGTGVLASGIAIHLTNGLTIAGLPDDFAALATGRFLGLQGMVWFMLATFVVGGVVLHFTNFGIRVFSVGGNRDAAYLAGIRVSFIRLMTFVVAGLCGGLAGVLLTARVQAGQPGISTTLTLYATAAVRLVVAHLLRRAPYCCRPEWLGHSWRRLFIATGRRGRCVHLGGMFRGHQASKINLPSASRRVGKTTIQVTRRRRSATNRI
jgi:ABC-type xylose transport system permease subunit